jgi:hypothetical protein
MTYSIKEIETLKTLGFSNSEILALAFRRNPPAGAPICCEKPAPAEKPAKKSAEKPVAKPAAPTFAPVYFRQLAREQYPSDKERAAFWAAWKIRRVVDLAILDKPRGRGRPSKAYKTAEYVREGRRLLEQAKTVCAANQAAKAA